VVPGERQAAALRIAVSQLHEELMLTLASGDPRVGTAYRLGRSLADTCRANQTGDDLLVSFDAYRLGQLYAWLTDLASALPPHAAKAIRMSLTWWRDTMFVDGIVTSAQGRQLLNGLTTTAPGLVARHGRRLGVLRKRGMSVTAGTPASAKAPSPDKYVAALGRQGELWRSVLSGEKKATDLLDANDYIDAARSALRTAWTLIRRPGLVVVVPVLVIVAALVGGLIWVDHLNATGGSKIGGFLGIVVAAGVATTRTVRPAVGGLGKRLEGPLWGAEVDLAIAHAVTIAPAGDADPSGWVAFVDKALKPDAPAAGA
jgi:hypothetical protein